MWIRWVEAALENRKMILLYFFSKYSREEIIKEGGGLWVNQVVDISNGYFIGDPVLLRSIRSSINSSVRVYYLWNSWYFLTEILRNQESPVLALRGGWGQGWLTILHGNMTSPLSPTLSNPQKKEDVITDEIGVSHLLPKYIIFKSKKDLISLTRLSPFVIEKRAVLEKLNK